MEAPVIPILSDSSEEIHVEVPIVLADPLVAPEVGAVSVISLTGVLDLVDYSSSSDSDSSKDSLPLAPELPLVLPFLCSDNSEVNSESEPAEQRPERHESLTDHDAMVLSTHPNGPHRRSSLDFTLDSSSSGSSSDSSSDTSSDSLSNSSSVYSSGCDASVRLLCSWMSAPLSTPYPPTTSESSLDSSSERSVDSSSSSAGPSRKRCRSPTTLVPSSTPVLRLIASTHVDLLPPHKRFRDSHSPEDSGEEHVEIGIGVEAATSDIREDDEEFEAKSSTGGMMEIVVDPLVTGGISESTGGDAPNLEGTLYDIAHYMSEVPLDRITEFETTRR
ncbi:hypothetical protein Tco_0460922 [Tanacetum coccineum]